MIKFIKITINFMQIESNTSYKHLKYNNLSQINYFCTKNCDKKKFNSDCEYPCIPKNPTIQYRGT